MKLEHMLLLMPDLQKILLERNFNILYYGDVIDFYSDDSHGIFLTRELLKKNVKQIRTGFQDNNIIHVELF